MGDHILRPMGAATLRIATDTQPGHCHGIDSVTEDVAGTLALEASDQHFKKPRDCVGMGGRADR